MPGTRIVTTFTAFTALHANYFFGRAPAYFVPKRNYFTSAGSSASPAGSTRIQPLIGRPLRSKMRV